ncbi:aminotransferase class IV [Sesbania bispinosa]|nr:aminotransferase class IV [Sesbania bispinosa]
MGEEGDKEWMRSGHEEEDGREGGAVCYVRRIRAVVAWQGDEDRSGAALTTAGYGRWRDDVFQHKGSGQRRNFRTVDARRGRNYMSANKPADYLWNKF